MTAYSHKYIAGADTTIVSSKDEGVLHSIVVGSTGLAGGLLTVSDNTGTIANLGVVDGIVTQNSYLFDVAYVGFLQVITGTPMAITVCYS